MDWLTITLLCALSLAASDALAKKKLNHLDLNTLTLIRLGFAGLLMLPVLMKSALPSLPPNFWAWMAVLIPAEIIAMYFYMKAIRDYPLSLTVPYLSFTPAFAIITARLFLGEQISSVGFGGIVLIIVGAWLLNISETDKLSLRRVFDPLKAIIRNKGSRYMLLAAFIYSFTATGGKAAMAYMPAVQFGSFYYVSVGIASLLIFGRKSAVVIKQNFIPAFFVAALMAVMVFLHFLALEQIEVAYMISVKRTSLLFGIIFGVLFFKEKHLALHMFAATIMLAGVFIIGVL